MLKDNIFVSARKDLYYLVKNYLFNLLILSTVNIVLFFMIQRKSFSLDWYHFILPLFAIIIGWSISSLIHNAAHANIFGPSISRITGELCGLVLFYGFPSFTLIHLLHHKFSDHDDDPVSPKGMSFLHFAFAPNRYVKKKTVAYQKSIFGKNLKFDKAIRLQNLFFNINYFSRVIFWFLLLGPELFLFFHIPLIISSILILAHINYISHRNLEDGSVEVVNYNHSLYYKIANFFTWGGYYHKNHHLNQKSFNPQKLGDLTNPLFSISPRNDHTVQGIKERELDDHEYLEKIYRYFKLDTVWGEANKRKLRTKNNIQEPNFPKKIITSHASD